MSVARLVPDGIGGRLALLLAAALLAANAVSLVLLSFERDRLGRAAQLERAVERIVDAVPLLETLPPGQRAAFLRRGEGRFAVLAVERRARVRGQTRPDERVGDLVARIGEALPGREVRATVRGRGDEAADRPRRAERMRPPRGERLVLSIELLRADGRQTGEWLNAVLRAPGAPPRERGGIAPLILVLGLSLVAVLGAALLYVRRLVRPLHDLAGAARAAGRGDRSARVPERGARELREAASAFNDMQARIARFDAERTRTLAAVGHDLRTPITSLRIRAEMLDDEAREPMVRTLDEMRVMADGLVAYARGEGDGEAGERIELAPFLERLCDERGATLSPPAPDAAALAVIGRPVGLTRAIGNLVDNAVRYAGAARVSLAREGGEAVVAVEDDGPGIPPERLEAMLEPFTRGDASRSLDTGGAGLGLSIARSIARNHGGELTLSNRPRGGLRAELRLPLA